MKIQSVVLHKVANRQTKKCKKIDKCQVKQNILGGVNYHMVKQWLAYCAVTLPTISTLILTKTK